MLPIIFASLPSFAPAPDAPPTLLGLQLGASGKFNITLGGKLWLSGGEVKVGAHCSSCGAGNVLKLQAAPVTSSGKDALGGYEATTYTWVGEPGTPIMETTFRYYAAANGTIVFEQRFPKGVPLDAVDAARTSEGAVTLFPGFERNNGGPWDSRACASYHGVFPQIKACKVSDYAESHQGGVPLVIYDADDDALPMTIFAPLSTPKAQHMTSDRTSFGAGVKASAAAIPAGWAQTWLLSGALGINEGFQAWGDRVLAFSGKPRADLYRDATHSTIGYWTDNGGFYHYSTGNGSHRAKNGSWVYAHTYEEVLPKVKASHDAAGVPFGHWQFDSWFYPKDGAVTGGGGGGGVTNWCPPPPPPPPPPLLAPPAPPLYAGGQEVPTLAARARPGLPTPPSSPRAWPRSIRRWAGCRW